MNQTSHPLKLASLISIGLLVLGLGIMLPFSACNKAGIPIYVKMDTAEVMVNPLTQGANTNAITDVWVQTTSLNLGAYSLPCNFPVLTYGNSVSFLVSAGIWQSGVSETRVIYPFYTADTFSIENPVLGNKYTHTPKYKYIPATVMPFGPESFEFSNDYDSNMVRQLGHTPLGGNLGNWCGVMVVNNSDTDKTAMQIVTYGLPAGQEIWMELDYKCQAPFWIGFEGTYNNGTPPTTVPVLFVVQQTNWTKIYVRFSDLVSQVAADNYRLYFEAIRPVGDITDTVFLDNIKVLHL